MIQEVIILIGLIILSWTVGTILFRCFGEPLIRIVKGLWKLKNGD